MARGASTRSSEASRPDDPPANYGQSSHGLRGDYSRMGPDYTVEQEYETYTEADQSRWRRLYERQIQLVPGRACDEYVQALNGLDYAAGIPRFETVTAQLEAATLQLIFSGFTLVLVWVWAIWVIYGAFKAAEKRQMQHTEMVSAWIQTLIVAAMVTVFLLF